MDSAPQTNPFTPSTSLPTLTHLSLSTPAASSTNPTNISPPTLLSTSSPTSPKPNRSFSFIFLPDEVLVRIFSYCSLETIATLLLVCKKFNQLAKDDAVWIQLSMKRWPSSFSTPQSHFLFKPNDYTSLKTNQWMNEYLQRHWLEHKFITGDYQKYLPQTPRCLNGFVQAKYLGKNCIATANFAKEISIHDFNPVLESKRAPTSVSKISIDQELTTLESVRNTNNQSDILISTCRLGNIYFSNAGKILRICHLYQPQPNEYQSSLPQPSLFKIEPLKKAKFFQKSSQNLPYHRYYNLDNVDFVSSSSVANSSSIILGTYNGLCHVVDIETGCKVTSWKAHSNIVTDISVDPHMCAVTGSSDKYVRFWDARCPLQHQNTPTPLFSIVPHSNTVTCLNYNWKLGLVYSGSRDCTVARIDLRTLPLQNQIFKCRNYKPSSIKIDPEAFSCLALTSNLKQEIDSVSNVSNVANVANASDNLPTHSPAETPIQTHHTLQQQQQQHHFDSKNPPSPLSLTSFNPKFTFSTPTTVSKLFSDDEKLIAACNGSLCIWNLRSSLSSKPNASIPIGTGSVSGLFVDKNLIYVSHSSGRYIICHFSSLFKGGRILDSRKITQQIFGLLTTKKQQGY